MNNATECDETKHKGWADFVHIYKDLFLKYLNVPTAEWMSIFLHLFVREIKLLSFVLK
jgi:hypothetical protein